MFDVLIDLTGKTFGKLTVLHRAVSRKTHGVRWMCKCQCGNLIIVDGHSLKKGTTKSCGCYQRQRVHETFYIHGREPKRLYSIWCTMKTRCYNQNSTKYHMYGARGISVCPEWKHDFITFRDWALNNGYADNLTINRIDNDGNYEPSNCQWSDARTQANNTRRNKYLTLNGETHTISEWSRITGLGLSCLYSRVRRGLSPEEVLRK